MQNKSIAKSLFTDALEGSLPKNFMHKYCSLEGDILCFEDVKYNLSEYKNLYVFGAGKAAYSMAIELEKIVGDKIYKGLIIAPYDEGKLKNIEVSLGSHPLPSQMSFDAAKKMIQLMHDCDEDDLYIFLLSGGSSALMESPLEPLTLQDIQITTNLLLRANLKIDEMNTIRKHLSAIKGGRLATMCKASGMVLVISDVIGNDLKSIGSGPLYCDDTTFLDAKNILDKKGLFRKLPDSVQVVLQDGIQGKLEESPSQSLERIKHKIIASNAQALAITCESANAKGLRVKMVQEPMEDEVSLMVEKMLKIAKNSEEECIIFGGECTVNLQGNGKGGRNQHAALLMLKKIHEQGLDMTFLSASTDGVDGNSDAAGAVVAYDDYSKELQNYLMNFDSYSYFKERDNLIQTGPTGTNVIDIAIIIKGE